jgi:2-methylisocitrate lyase-like PEP mutase family enzyme
VRDATSKPLNVLAFPGLTWSEITDAGGQRISVGSQLTWVAVAAMAEAAESLQAGTDYSALAATVKLKEWFGD